MTTSVDILDTSLHVVHVPKNCVRDHMADIVECIWFRREDDPFFSLSANDVELSLVAEKSVVERTFLNSDRLNRAVSEFEQTPKPTSFLSRSTEGSIHVDTDLWVVLEVQFASQGWQDAGIRVKELAAPLADQGISILFLSAYNADFILLKRRDLPKVLKTLEKSGFHLLTRPDVPSSASHGGSANDSESDDDHDTDFVEGLQSFVKEEHHVDSEDLAQRLHPLSIQRAPNDKKDKLAHLTESHTSSPIPISSPMQASTASLRNVQLADLVSILPDELVLVGLSEHETSWRHKLVEMIFYPELILPSHSSSDHQDMGSSQHSDSSNFSSLSSEKSVASSRLSTYQSGPPAPFFTLSQTKDSGTSLTCDLRLLRALFAGDPFQADNAVFTEGNSGLFGKWHSEDGAQDDEPNAVHIREILKCLRLDLSGFGLDKHGIVDIVADALISGDVNLLYQSGAKTANILVAKTQIAQAQSSLQGRVA